ncbi:hypothetical protein BKA70DRAFT_1446624 [Coprinopsis sp. MPI-PUGE-AT-0042]|nr:hypothetical protein BKA70DRAFT_1446624 [Coprinopsis sp. MPI-PUGE-AT-0042]
MSRSSTTLPSSSPPQADCASPETFESELQREYQKQMSSVQATMGLQSDDWMFWQVKTAVAAVTRKLGLMSRTVLKDGNGAKNGKSTFSLELDRAAWWTARFKLEQVRDRVPVGLNYQSLREPIDSILQIRRSDIDKREAHFRERNGSTATLPDFDRLLELEELDYQKGRPQVEFTADDICT